MATRIIEGARPAAGGGSTTSAAPAPPAPYRRGLPDALKASIEAMSGLWMGDVRVHYNSPKPAELQAHAYARGIDIHLAPGQERHLPHEAWHVVQQKQGRVRPTGQVGGSAISDDAGLEAEAVAQGERASRGCPAPRVSSGRVSGPRTDVVQRAAIKVKVLSKDGSVYVGMNNAGPLKLEHGDGVLWVGPRETGTVYGERGQLHRLEAARTLNFIDMSEAVNVATVVKALKTADQALPQDLLASLSSHDFIYALDQGVARYADSLMAYYEKKARKESDWPADRYGVTRRSVDDAISSGRDAGNQGSLFVHSIIDTFAGSNSVNAVRLDADEFLGAPSLHVLARKDNTETDRTFGKALLTAMAGLSVAGPQTFDGLYVPKGMMFGGWTPAMTEVLVWKADSNLRKPAGGTAVPSGGSAPDTSLGDATLQVGAAASGTRSQR